MVIRYPDEVDDLPLALTRETRNAILLYPLSSSVERRIALEPWDDKVTLADIAYIVQGLTNVVGKYAPGGRLYDIEHGSGLSNHASTHQDGGADEINVGGLSGELADPQPPKAHAASHKHGGSDEVATATPGANAIPKANSGGRLDVGWLTPAGSTTQIQFNDGGALGGDAELLWDKTNNVLSVKETVGGQCRIIIGNSTSVNSGLIAASSLMANRAIVLMQLGAPRYRASWIVNSQRTNFDAYDDTGAQYIDGLWSARVHMFHSGTGGNRAALKLVEVSSQPRVGIGFSYASASSSILAALHVSSTGSSGDILADSTIRALGGYIAPDGSAGIDATIQFEDREGRLHDVNIIGGIIIQWDVT